MQQRSLPAAGPFHWLTEQETIGHDIILPGRSASCLTFFTQETHTTHIRQEMASINTHLQGNNQHGCWYTGSDTHLRKWATSTAGCRSVRKTQTHRGHRLRKGYKPEITIECACKLDTTLFPPCTATEGSEGCAAMSSGCLSLVPGSFSPFLQRGSSCLGDTLWRAWVQLGHRWWKASGHKRRPSY